MSKRITIIFKDEQQKVLDEMMKDDIQDNYTYFITNLVIQEYKRRQETQLKRNVGRPKKEGESKKLYYPAPYKGGAPYDKETLEAYYAFRKEEMPPLPQPLTEEELKQWDM